MKYSLLIGALIATLGLSACNKSANSPPPNDASSPAAATGTTGNTGSTGAMSPDANKGNVAPPSGEAATPPPAQK